MTPLVAAAVLLAAVTHASWNAIAHPDAPDFHIGYYRSSAALCVSFQVLRLVP